MSQTVNVLKCPVKRKIVNNEGTHLKNCEPSLKIPKMNSHHYQQLIGGIYNTRTADIQFTFQENGQEKIPVHKIILASDSKVFYQIFFENKLVGNQKHYLNTTSDIFCIFLSSFYRSSMRLERDDVPKLMYLAYEFDANKCKQICHRFLKRTLETGVDDMLWVLQLTITYNCQEIYKQCMEMVHSFSHYLIETEQFKTCSLDVVKIILNDEFDGRNEWKLFEACVKWAKYVISISKQTVSLEKIRCELGDCFQQIRFKSMSSKEFVQCLSKYAHIFSKNEISDISKAIADTEQKDTPMIQRKPPKPVFRGRLMTLNHAFEDRSTFCHLLNDTKTSDINFVFDEIDDRISAHRSILAIKSTYFENKFGKETNITDFPIKSTSFKAFTAFLKLIYGYPFDVVELNDAEKILELAYEYDVKNIFRGYEKEFKKLLNQENLFWAYNLSKKFQFVDWMDFDQAWIKRHCCKINLNGAFHANSLVHCSRNVVKHVLDIDYQDRNELLVFEAAINWAKNRCIYNRTDPNVIENLRNVMKGVIYLIRFHNMTANQFERCRNDYPGLLKENEIKTILPSIPQNRTTTHQ